MKLTNLMAIFISGIFPVFVSAGIVPDTGQKRCYDSTSEISCTQSGIAGYGQDAHYTINPPVFTKLDDQGNALPDSADQWVMVKDKVTGLIWEVKHNGDDIKNYDDPHDADNDYTWYDSRLETGSGTPGDGTDTEDMINELNAEKFGGFSDWRIPTIKELVYLINLTENSDYFSDTCALWWACDTFAGNSEEAWVVSRASVSNMVKSGKCCVRAVRGETLSSEPFVMNGDSTVTDPNTGLMWQQQAPNLIMNWLSALEYAEKLTLGGYNDWRLPNRSELVSIIDYSRIDPVIDQIYFPNTILDFHWSSTTYPMSPAQAWAVSFRSGRVQSIDKKQGLIVLTVRGGQNLVSGRQVILTPVQASKWDTGTSMSITWEPQTMNGDVNISISRYGGRDNTFETIAESTENDGSFEWTVTSPGSSRCAIKIAPADDLSIGVIQGLFTISGAQDKAIIIAGGGIDHPGWHGICSVTGMAFNTLIHQGFYKETIFYLCPDQNIDIDGDGIFDVDSEASSQSLEHAITTWAKYADNLLIYLAGPGDTGRFYINAGDIIEAQTLKSWLDGIQDTIKGKMVVLYDAPKSGSFIPLLAGKNRIIAAGSSQDKSAVLSGNGSVSFSAFFWKELDRGTSFYESFKKAGNTIGLMYEQNPVIDANGDGIGNEGVDKTLAEDIQVGKEVVISNDLPLIDNVSAEPDLLLDSVSAAITVNYVMDLNGIYRVWAMISPSGKFQYTGSELILDMPVVDLESKESGAYSVTYDGFSTPGIYRIAVFAEDIKGAISSPESLQITKTSGSTLAVDFGEYGIYLFDRNNWEWIGGNPAHMAAWNKKLVGNFPGYGLYYYENNSWNRISGNAVNIAAWGDELVIDFGWSRGISLYNPNGYLRKLTELSAQNITGWGNRLAADFGQGGLYLFEENKWTWITGDPEDMEAWENKLAVDLGAAGLYLYDGSSWEKIAGDSDGMQAWGDKIAVNFAGYGLYLYAGNSWTWIGGSPEAMSVWRNKLAADYGAWGLYLYDGTSWEWIAPSPEAMVSDVGVPR